MPVNDRIFDFQVAQQIRWLRLGNRTLAQILRTMTRLDGAIETQLRSASLGDGTFRRRQLQAMRSQIADLQRAWHNNELRPFMTKTLDEVRGLAARGEADMLRRVMSPVLRARPGGALGVIDVVTPNVGALNALSDPSHLRNMINGSSMTEWFDQLRENDVRRTWRRISEGVLSGETTDQITRGVNGSRALRYRDGVREVSRRGVGTLVRTSINHAQNAGRELVWNANADLINGIQWVSTLDTRTTPICRARDGQVYGLEEGPRPPAHPNCRSTTIPVTKSWEELGLNSADLTPGTRASMNGQVPRNMTYYEWLNRQSADVQREAVGPSRFRMWKEGGVRPERFYRDDGYTYTLDDLRSRLGSDIVAMSTRRATTGLSGGGNVLDAGIMRAMYGMDDASLALYRKSVGDIMPDDLGRMLLGSLDEFDDVAVSTRAFFRANHGGREYQQFVLTVEHPSIRMTRSIDFASGTVKHDFLRLSPELQNTRIGRRLLAAQVRQYQAMGLRRIELDANIDVGGYAWARYGFRPKDVDAFRRMVNRRVDDLNLNEDQLNAVANALNSPEPAWMVSDLRVMVTYNGRRVTLGKALLLDQWWGGFIDLNEVAAMTRFFNYVR